MARHRVTAAQIPARFVDGPYAGEDRVIGAGADGGPPMRITLPDPDQATEAPGVTYERASWGDLGEAVRYRVAPAEEPVYEVVATRWQQGWALEVVGVGATQSDVDDRNVSEDGVRDYLHLMLDRPADSFNVQIKYQDSPS